MTQHLAAPLTYVLVYGRLKHRFRAGLYEEIADGWFAEVLAFLGEELRRALGGMGEVVICPMLYFARHLSLPNVSANVSASAAQRAALSIFRANTGTEIPCLIH